MLHGALRVCLQGLFPSLALLKMNTLLAENWKDSSVFLLGKFGLGHLTRGEELNVKH